MNIKQYFVPALAAVLLTGCVDESGLYEKFDVEALRTSSVFQLKNSGKKTCTYKVNLEGVVMSAADNFESGVYAFQDGEEAQDGILLKTTGSFAFGEKVNVNLDGMLLSKEGDLFVMSDPDGKHVTSVAKSSALNPVSITAKTLAGGTFQSMYVSMEGWQVIEEDLEKAYGEGVKIESQDRDTVLVKVLSSASFASTKVAQGCGKISGIVSQDNGAYVIMPQSADDVEFTDKRFTFKTEESKAAIVWSEGSSLTGFVSEVSSIEMSGAKVLEGNANCFVVSAPGTYCFDAKTPEGKYPEGVAEGSKIYVKVAALGGNAIVAMLDDNKAIAWTWHIWCSEKSLDEMSVDCGTIKAFDRLLGATSVTPGDPAACGLYFQWGRKDAFPGPSIKGDFANDKETQSEAELNGVATATTTINTDLGVAAWNVTDAVAAASAQAAAAIPTTYLSTQTWANTPGGAADTWTAISDPCPAGWHVPTAAEAVAFLGVEADTEFSGMDMTNLGSNYKGLWFPSNGDRARKAGRLVSLGRRHFSWLNTVSSDKGNYMGIYSTKIVPSGSFNRGNATGVRCVKTK